MTKDTRRTVLITGCSSGIGASLAITFAKRGLRVFATARDASSLSSLSAGYGIETFNLTVDNPSSIASLYTEISALVGDDGLDYLVNNAGRNYTVPALDVDFNEIQQTFETNVFGVMRICQTFAPLLVAARSKDPYGKDGGTIVQIGSVAAITPYVFGSVYNASKAALHAYSDTLRVELAPLGVRVITIVTGGVQSNIARTDRVLPTQSYYGPLETEYLRRVKHSQEGAMPNKDYAESVVRQVLADRDVSVLGWLPKMLGLRKRARHIYEGNKSWIVWVVYWLLPDGTFDIFFRQEFKTWKLEAAQKSGKTKVG